MKFSACNNPGYTHDIICFRELRDAFRKACPSSAAQVIKKYSAFQKTNIEKNNQGSGNKHRCYTNEE